MKLYTLKILVLYNINSNQSFVIVKFNLNLFSTIMFCSSNYTDEERKTLQSIPKQYIFGLLIIVMIVL